MLRNASSNSRSTSSSPLRFNTLGWGNATADRPYGVIAGGTENGDLELWDPAAILEDKG